MTPRRLAPLAPLALLAAIAAAGCATKSPALPPTGPLVLAPALVAPPGPRPALADPARGVDWHGCGDLSKSLQEGLPGEAVDELSERPEFAAYVDCLAPALVAQGRAPEAGGLAADGAGQRLGRDLDLATVRSSLAQRRPAEHYRLADFEFPAVQVTDHAVAMVDAGFAYDFQVLAVGDFRASGHAEYLVRFIDRATNGGSYDRTAILIVDPAADGSLAATDALDVLRAPAR